MEIFPVCVHEVDRKDAGQTVQYVQPDQGLFLASANSVWYVFPVCVKGMTMKDAERTVQYVQSHQGLFVAGAKCREYENSAGPDLPMRTLERSRHSLDSRHEGIHACQIRIYILYALLWLQGQSFLVQECTQYW